MIESVEFEAEMLVECLNRTRQAIKTTEERIKNIGCSLPDFRYLLSIPGFGPDVSAKVIDPLATPIALIVVNRY